jgi:hypothetical protein
LFIRYFVTNLALIYLAILGIKSFSLIQLT